MSGDPRAILLTALQAANFDSPLPPDLDQAVRVGKADLELAAFGLDSLGVMELCISIELQTGLELTPMLVGDMAYVADVEGWLRERL